MATINLTSNLKLQKPTSDEKYNVQTQNTNMDILDSSIKTLQDKDTTFTKQTDFAAHTNNKNNPHNVTKEQLGLSNVVNLRQIPAIQTDVTNGGIPIFDANGYTLKDSGFTIGKSVPADAKFTDTVYTHPNSGVIPNTYKSVSVDENGHVVGGYNPTTLAGYGITDAASIGHTHTVEEIGADAVGSASSALSKAKEYTDLKVIEYQGENILIKQIVESLPTENINTNTIYLVLKPDANGNNNYNEYINLDGTSSGYEWIGNTFVDLTDYYNKTESNNLFLLRANIANNLTTAAEGKVLDAAQGKVLDGKVAANTTSINELNQKLPIINAIASPLKDNLLMVNTSDKYGEDNKTRYFSSPTYNAPVSGTFIGEWNCHWRNASHILVELLEFYPVHGRIWTNFYNVASWTGWTSTTPSNTTSGNGIPGTKFPGGIDYRVKNGWAFVTMELQPSGNIAHDDIVCTGLPIPTTNIFLGLTTTHSDGGTYTAQLMLTGVMRIYYPGFILPARIDCCFSYPVNE